MRPSPVPPAEIESILRQVRARFGERPEAAAESAPGSPPRPRPAAPALGEGIHPTVEGAVTAAAAAFGRFAEAGLERRRTVVAAIRRAMLESAEELGALAREETGLGRTGDKALKNRLVAGKTPGTEDLEPETVTGDHGTTITEYAPFGIVASITPTTNPTSTIINNSIAILAAGNAVVFNVHPNAKAVSVETVRRLNRAIVGAGGPPDLVTALPEPTIASAQELMAHRRVRLLLVTGGPGVVEEALKTRKRAITAGPGNPPVVVDDTADIGHAAREIVRGASFDNNVVCTDEKEVFVVASKADELLRAMGRGGAVVLTPHQLRQIERVIFREPGAPGKPGRIDPRWIGKNAGAILAEIGVAAGDEVRLAVAEVPREHSLVWTEQMMPVLPVVRVGSVDEAIDLAHAAEHGFRHTASIFSRDVSTITRMARLMNVSIFVANAANLAGLGDGGEGFTSYSIATPTGEGLTRPRTFSRVRRFTVAGSLRVV